MNISRLAALGLIVLTSLANAEKTEEPSLTRIQKILIANKMVDLTHKFERGIPHWPGFPDEKRQTLYWYDKGRGTMGTGFFAERYTLVGQWGTHIDPPVHYQIDLKEMILPLVVIDVHVEAAQNPDYTLSVDRVKNWESDHDRSRTGHS